MSEAQASGNEGIARLTRKYRKHITGAVTAVALYALLGFFFVPWLVNKIAVESVHEQLGAGLSFEKVEFNPFVLSLRLQGLALDDRSGEPVTRIDNIFVNFQLSSVFRWAYTFSEFHIDVPQFFVVRDTNGVFNLSKLVPERPTAEAQPVNDESSLVRLLVMDFAFRDGILHWDDQYPAEPVVTRFEPITIAIQDLNTIPQRAGQQEVIITTETSGTLSWSGSLELNPFNSTGTASIKGSHFPLLSAYIRHEAGFDVVDGTADVALAYDVSTASDGTVTADVDNFQLAFHDVQVLTFSPDVDHERRQILTLPNLSLTGGNLRWPDQSVSLDAISVDNAVVSALRDKDGNLNLTPVAADSDEAKSFDVEDTTTEPGSEWRVSVNNFSIDNLSFDLDDQSITPAASVGIESLDLTVTGIDNLEGTSFPTDLKIVPRTGGIITLTGSVVALPAPIVDMNLNIDMLQLAGAHPYLQPLADVNLDSGAMNLSASVQSNADDPLAFSGDMSIVDFLITETDEGTRLGSWSDLNIKQFAYSDAGKSLQISEIEFMEPYGDIVIAEDGSVNLGRIEKGIQRAGEEPSDAKPEEEVEVEAVVETGAEKSSTSEIGVTVGRVVIANASADFADRSLPLPFEANIAELNGDVSTIATTSTEPSTVALEGKVDEFGFVRVSGTVTPLDTKRNTDLKVQFQNVEMPKFSAYTIPFAGRKIDSGKLDLDLGYAVTESELVGENKVVLRDLNLGEEVDHPDAMSLPLGLAVALLKDSEGKIDIDLPVRGNVDDPEFRYGGVIMGALGNLIIKIVASPFALLGNLLGVEASELDHITFLAGRSDLTPPEMERTAQLAEALALRPELVLEVNGVIAREADSLALQTMKLDAAVEERVAALGDTDGAMFAEQQLEVLEQMFTESGIADMPQAALDALRLQFTTAAVDGAETSTDQFDQLAFTNDLRQQLIAIQVVEDSELAALANARASNTSEAIVAANAELQGRTVIGGPQAIEAESDDTVRMKVTLKTGSDIQPSSELEVLESP